MIKVLALELNEQAFQHYYSALLPYVAAERKNQLDGFNEQEDACRALFAHLLAKYAVSTNTGMRLESIEFCRNEYGKPFVCGLNGFHFNVSHSGSWVVCAVDTAPVGIDVELIGPIDLDIADNYLSLAECVLLNNRPPAERLSFFYEFWTLKESYIKQQGKGLSIDLHSFSMNIGSCGNIGITHHYDHQCLPLFFKQYHIGQQYKMAVCATSNSFAAIKFIDLAELFVYFQTAGDRA